MQNNAKHHYNRINVTMFQSKKGERIKYFCVLRRGLGRFIYVGAVGDEGCGGRTQFAPTVGDAGTARRVAAPYGGGRMDEDADETPAL